ncbi:unnamed protein product [Lactuca saligna]|uniref:Reverse transcriptase zinc-binding domain-containing protein n=1 Tax=Lactuca saligna TaxID=75948 RepID=A0AA35Y0F3_LACSI|nr:unnamed protein product [Lactuca saligna]
MVSTRWSFLGRKLIISPPPHPTPSIIWCKEVPIKVIGFMWRPVQGRIPMAMALSHRGIVLHSWCGVDNSQFTSVDDLINYANNWGSSLGFKPPFPCLIRQRKWKDTKESSRTRMNGRWHEVSVIDREKGRLLRGSTRPKGKSLEATVVSVGAARSFSSSFSVACFSPDSWLRRKYEEEVREARVGSIGATATPGGCLAAVFRQWEKRKCDEISIGNYLDTVPLCDPGHVRNAFVLDWEGMKKNDGDEAVLLLEIKRKKKKRGCDRYKDREGQQPSSLAEDPESSMAEDLETGKKWYKKISFFFNI